ncbi:helix-turn-helix transcriptional regulator [Arenicella xantha]|uniref:Autoinducer binding domain-containing protein n=1 Tax=Arenicella xantha TaxID=644221 RepID=A0A395JKK0_9GAMM|nr:LuxR C-terminal-related transcriptional regulator [Arenicella xantha]RBP51089.1 autoinducer binding domain-containing protein [Arenicella xantha]
MKQVKLIESLDDLDSVWKAFVPLARELGFDYVVYTISNHNNDEFFYYDNFGLHSDNEADFYDPFLEFCCHSYDTMFTGLEFSEFNAGYNLPPKAIELIELGAKLGMISGLAIPLRLAGSNRYGGFNLGTGLKRKAHQALCAEVEGAAQVACMLVHRHIEKILDRKNIMVAPNTVKDSSANADTNGLENLTPKENRVLKKIANGYSRKKCAEALCVSESTVSTHMKNIYRKLGVHNRVQATKIIVEHELSISN